MNKEIVLEGVSIRGASLHNGDQRHGRVELTGVYAGEIREEMNWGLEAEDMETLGSTDLVGTLAITEAVLVPTAPVAKNGHMEQHSETLKAQELSGFSLVPVKDKKGEVLSRELRFTMKTSAASVSRIVNYVVLLGRAPGTLTVTLAEQGTGQQNLPGTK